LQAYLGEKEERRWGRDHQEESNVLQGQYAREKEKEKRLWQEANETAYKLPLHHPC
jgi:hypothetical protein